VNGLSVMNEVSNYSFKFELNERSENKRTIERKGTQISKAINKVLQDVYLQTNKNPHLFLFFKKCVRCIVLLKT